MANGESYIPSTDQDQRVANSDSIHLGSAEQIEEQMRFVLWVEEILYGNHDPEAWNQQLPEIDDLSFYITHRFEEYEKIHFENILHAITRGDKDAIFQILHNFGYHITGYDPDLSWDDNTLIDVNANTVEVNIDNALKRFSKFSGIGTLVLHNHKKRLEEKCRDCIQRVSGRYWLSIKSMLVYKTLHNDNTSY